MLHRIAMSLTSGGDLNLIFLSPTNGQPLTFFQTSDGAWHPTKNQGGSPTLIQNPAPTTMFQAILGAGVKGLIALDQNGSLWQTTQNGTTWNGFSLLPNALQPKPAFVDFATCSGQIDPIFLVACSQALSESNLYLQAGSNLAAMPQPVLASLPQMVRIPTGSYPMVFSSVAAAQFGNQSAAAVVDPVKGWAVWTSNGQTWSGGPLPASNVPFFQPTACVLVPGNGGLQAIVLNGNDHNLYLWWWAGPGSDWSWYGKLPNPDGVSFTTMAAAMGADSHLQVVGIGTDGLPYLIWQNQEGTWAPYKNPDGQGMQLPMKSQAAIPLMDLVMGTGNQDYLQVGYIGADGNIYVNWQNKNGTWDWYGPLP
jgi:hypothetical protein